MNFIQISEIKNVKSASADTFVINVTGHRPDKLNHVWSTFSDKNKYILDAFKYFLWKTIECKAKKGIKHFKLISGMALGIDSIFVRASKACQKYYATKGIKVEIIGAIPCLRQYAYWRPTSRAEYKKLLKYCDSGKLINLKYSAKGMQLRNVWMVEQADMTVCYWNGTDGGTKNCLASASYKGNPIVNVYNIAQGYKEKETK
jgi:hypothetical protein